MKKLLSLSLLLFLLGSLLTAQVPQKISYQAVIRNSSNALVASQAVKMKITILKGSATGTEVYVETHNPTTNANGIVTIEIGGGTVVSGVFADIDWATGSTFVKTETDPTGGTNYTLSGTSQLLTVPYAMVANKLSGPVSKMEVKGSTTSLDEALFEVKNKDGQTVFAVYNEGVRIYVDNGAKGKGGFSVGGFGNAKAESQNLLVVSPDSIRAYVGTDPTGKGTKGGFAISSFGGAKAAPQPLWIVNPDSIRGYVSETLTTKGSKGGFAISSYGGSKGVSQELLTINPDSIRAYINSPLTSKGKKGGFAISSYDGAKGIVSDMIRITTDSTRVYLPAGTTKGTKGGFAISSYGNGKGDGTNYFYLSQDSTRFYVMGDSTGMPSSFDIIGVGSGFQQRPLFTATADTVGIGGVLNVQNDLKVGGNINYAGNVTLIVPDLHTIESFNVTDTSAMISWDIISNGGSPIVASGVVWSTSTNPTISLLTKTNDTITSGYATSLITGLAASTTYYVRPYATNADGTGYGPEVTFTTSAPPVTITDADGNSYNIVTIGTQNWFATNLRTTKYNDGSSIPKVTDEAAWINLSTPAYTWYSNDSLTYNGYGALYNWATVNTGNLCPVGYKVASEADWMTLASFLGGTLVAGGKLKEAGLTHWMSPNTGATNEVGFTALPGGLRTYMGPFASVGQSGNWWTSTRISTDPTSITMGAGAEDLMVQFSFDKMGMSVRCIEVIAK